MPIDSRVRARVAQRLASSRQGTASQAMLVDVSHGFKSAPLARPPIAEGMTASLNELKRLILDSDTLASSDYTRIPILLRRLRYLLRVFYDAQHTGRKTTEFKYCDIPNMIDLGITLHEIGLTLQMIPYRLRALFNQAPDMDTFILDEPLDVGKWREAAQKIEDAVAADTESSDDDRMESMEIEEKAGQDLAAYHMSYFMGDILVGWLLISPGDDIERKRAARCMERVVEYSTLPIWRKALGDPFTDTMRPIYWKPELLVRFAHAGGLPALYDDWAMSMGMYDTCPAALKSLPSEAWKHQTPASLKGIMQGLLHKVEVEGETIINDPLFVQAVYEMHSRYGLAPFEVGSKLSDSQIIFYFIHRRISRKPEDYKSLRSITNLLAKYARVPQTTRRRHGWMILTISGRWDCLDLYGCKNKASCPELAALQGIREKRVRGVRDPTVEDRLYKWGGESKACTNCRSVSYCSVVCQKEHWSQHKVLCKKNTPKDKTQVEVEI